MANNILGWISKGLDVAKLLTIGTPIGAVITVIDAVVETVNDGVSNESVKSTLLSMSKSKWNNLTPDKILRINAILDEKTEAAANE